MDDFLLDLEEKVLDLSDYDYAGSAAETSAKLAENVGMSDALVIGFVVGALCAWLAGWVLALSYSSSPSHNIIAKGLGWFAAVPIAYMMGNFIGQAAAPHWWAFVRIPYFAGYGFLATWFAIAVVGHEDFLETAKDKAGKAINDHVQSAKDKAAERKQFEAPDPFANN